MAAHDLVALAAQIAAFAGAAPVLDPRLQLAPCATVAIAWAGPRHDAVTASCADPAWRIFVGVRVERPPSLVHRGDQVPVAVGGDGYSVSRDAVAENDAAAGERVRVRIGAVRLSGRVQADGSVTVP